MSQLRNAQFFLFLFLRYFSPRSAFSADCRSKSSVKQKQTLNKMRSEGSWTSTKRRVLFAIVWIWVGWFGVFIFLTFVSATFLQFLCIHGYGLDVCSCVYVYMSMFSLSLCFQWLYPREDTFHHHFFPTVGFHLNLRQKNIQYIIWYRTSESIRSRTCSRISNWMCVCQRNPHDKWLECVYFFVTMTFFLQPSSWKPLFISLTVVVDVDVVGIVFQWGFFFLILFACANIERERARAQAQ